MEKKDIALKQLRASAKHYNACDYVCAITLAGAAEEILRAIADKRTKTKAIEHEIKYIKSIHKAFGLQALDKEILKNINRVKNQLKHNDQGDNDWVEGDFENEAVMLFVKAVKQYHRAYNELPKDRVIVGLFDNLTL